MGLLDSLVNTAAPTKDGDGLKNVTDAVSNDNVRSWATDQAEDPSYPYAFTYDTGLRWNKSYPYQLIIVKKDASNNTYSQSEYGPAFTLPIPPQDLSMSMPFAITTTATLGGVVEEHNGAPFRMISFSGTTGVLPLRGPGDCLKERSSLGSIFAGTISAVDNVISSVNKLTSGSGPVNNSVVANSEFNGTAGKNTGYFQFRLLQRFLESYANLKKKPSGRLLRLAVAIWKDEGVYLCTPVSFDVRRTSSSPWEYSYSLSFKAWRRIKDLGNGPNEYDRAGPSLRDQSTFQSIITKIGEAREVLQNARDVLQAIGGDIDNSLLNPIREVTYFVKDAVGVAMAVADLPKTVIRDLKETCTDIGSLNRIDQRLKDYYISTGKDINDDLQDLWGLSNATGKAETGNGNLALASLALEGALPAVKIFDNADDHYSLLATLQPSDLNVPPAVQKKINAETTRIRLLTRLDFENKRDAVQAFADDFADKVGAGSTSFNRQFGVNLPTSTRTPTPDEWDVIFAMNQVIMEMNRLAASGNINRSDSVSSVDYIAGLAQASGIAFKRPASKFAVPMPYGSTLEVVALQYLGDPQRWMEIAALNGLQSPYVDEVGFDLVLSVNGRGNQVQVADASSLYVGQQVWLSSTTTARTMRHINKIEKVTNNTTVTLDGEADLDRFKTMAQATLHAFLPNTCNSMQTIYIPSELPPGEVDDKLRAIPGIDEFDPLIRVGGIDLLLTSSGDLTMTNDGDCPVAVGLTNIIQKIRIALNTPKGKLIYFPSYGLGISIGDSVADIEVAKVSSSIQNLLVSDPTFVGIEGTSVKLNGGVMQISFGVRIKGVEAVVPVNFSVRR